MAEERNTSYDLGEFTYDYGDSSVLFPHYNGELKGNNVDRFWDHGVYFQQMGRGELAISRTYVEIDDPEFLHMMKKVKQNTNYQIYAETIWYKLSPEWVLLILAEAGVSLPDAIRVARLRTNADTERYLGKHTTHDRRGFGFKRTREQYETKKSEYKKKRRKVDHECQVVSNQSVHNVKTAVLRYFPAPITGLIMGTLWDIAMLKA